MDVINYTVSTVQAPAPVRKSWRRNDKAEMYFRSIKKIRKEPSRAWHLAFFKKTWPGYVPEAFFTTGNYKRRKAYELLRGQLSTLLSDNCGSVGRLRVIAGKPLERSIISFSVLPRASSFDTDPDAQFSQQVMDWVKEDLAQFFVKGPFIAFIERGRNGENHVNVLHKQGGCKRGATRLVPDSRLFLTITYFCKKPYWNDGNALAYLRSANLSKRVGRRIIKHRLGDSRTRKIAVLEVEIILKMSLLKSKKTRVTT